LAFTLVLRMGGWAGWGGRTQVAPLRGDHTYKASLPRFGEGAAGAAARATPEPGGAGGGRKEHVERRDRDQEGAAEEERAAAAAAAAEDVDEDELDAVTTAGPRIPFFSQEAVTAAALPSPRASFNYRTFRSGTFVVDRTLFSC